MGLADGCEAEPFARRTSMLVSPADGQLPPLTPQAEALRAAGRSSWIAEGRSTTGSTTSTPGTAASRRGFPASMLPFRYNNGIRVFQAPGYVVIHFEMLGNRVIPLAPAPSHWPEPVEAVARQQRRPLGRQHAGDRDHQHQDRRQRHARRLAPRGSPLNMATGRAGRTTDPDQRAGQGGRAADPDRPGRAHLRADLFRPGGVHRAVDRAARPGRATTTTSSTNTPATKATCRCATTSPPRAPSGARRAA